MKRVIVLGLMILVVFTTTGLIAPKQSLALEPLSCMNAADLGWRNHNWNLFCLWALQMDPDWNQGEDGSWNWR